MLSHWSCVHQPVSGKPIYEKHASATLSRDRILNYKATMPTMYEKPFVFVTVLLDCLSVLFVCLDFSNWYFEPINYLWLILKLIYRLCQRAPRFIPEHKELVCYDGDDHCG